MSQQVKPRDCPLCGQKEAIPIKNQYYDYDAHIPNCPELEEIKPQHKKKFLISKFKGEIPAELLNDNLTIDDYQNILNKNGLEFDLRGYRRKLERSNWAYFWSHILTIRHHEYVSIGKDQFHYMEAESKDPNKAFELIRHFLCCGERIKIPATDGNVMLWHWDGGLKDLVYDGLKTYAEVFGRKTLQS